MRARFVWLLDDAAPDQMLIPPPSADAGHWREILRMADAVAEAGSSITLHEAREYAVGRVIAEEGLKPLSASRMLPYWARFELFADRRDGIRLVSELTQECVQAFVEAKSASGNRPGASSMALRQTSLRYWFRILRRAGLMVGDVTLDLDIPKRDTNYSRQLTDDEMSALRAAADGALFSGRPTLIVALLEAGASSLDLREIRVRDVDLDARRVWIHGGLKGWPRWTALSDWGVASLSARVLGATDLDCPVLDLFDLNDHSARMGISMALRRTFRRAGIDATDKVRARSISMWAANRILAADGLEAAARHLGLRSLDRTATILGYEWRGEA